MPVQKINFKVLFTLSIALLALFSVPGFGLAQIYVEPEGTPPQSTPNRNPAAPDPAIQFLNGSSAEQRKLGSLVLGERNGRLADCTATNNAGCSRLCLNGDTSLVPNDPECIQDWSEVTFFAGGPFLRLLGEPQASQVDPGFVSLRSFAFNQQLVSLIGEANNLVDGATGIRAESTSTSSYAGQFSGRVVIQRSTGSASLCLHGSCITSWTNAVPTPADAIQLQTSGYFGQQSGHASLSGVLMADSIVSGTPTSDSPMVATCGDGLCSAENLEDPILCSLDC